jgi:translation elongation factor EF-4
MHACICVCVCVCTYGNIWMSNVCLELLRHTNCMTWRVWQGYASMEYALIEYRQNDLVKLDVAVNGDNVSPMSLCLVWT